MDTTRVVLVICAASLCSIVGCNDDVKYSGDEREESLCDEAADRLRSCGLLSEGETGCDELPDRDLDNQQRCLFECITQTEGCGTLTESLCRDDQGKGVFLAQCLGQCLNSNTGFDCGSGTVLPQEFVCDGTPDCDDGDDEVNCSQAPNFRCANGETVSTAFVCDGIEDCDGGSDETGCSVVFEEAQSICMESPRPDAGGCGPNRDDLCRCFLDVNGAETFDCFEGATDNGDPCTCGDEPAPGPRGTYRFVLLEDLTEFQEGDYPGADLDAVGLIKANGEELFASLFENDTDISCENNLACDPTALLGAPDAIIDGECFGGGVPDGSLFTSMNGGFAIVQFSSVVNGDTIIENGDNIHVYEVGARECGRFNDDPIRVSVSVADNITGHFLDLGDAGGPGVNIVPVSGL